MKNLWIFLIIFSAWSQNKTQQEKEIESINFNELKTILKDDFLAPTVEEKKGAVQEIKKERKTKRIEKYSYPEEKDFWSFISEFWLVKNAALLSWDFKKPDYGLRNAVESLFETLGLYQVKFRILPLNTPTLTHFSLPADNNEYIFLMSVPFMRALDLSKSEIALLVLEDYFRQKLGYFNANLKVEGMNKIWGANFYDKKIDLSHVDELLKAYSSIAFEKGYNFQQQYEVTKKMDQLLKSNPVLWNKYFQLLSKIEKLVKSNMVYESYNKIYPSPEMQIKWLSPKEKIL